MEPGLTPMVRRWTLLLAGIAVLTGCASSPSYRAASRSAPPRPSADLVRLVDVAQDVGLAFRHGAFRWQVPADPAAMLGGGLCWFDYDGDGWMDLFVTNSYARGETGRWMEEGGLPTSALFHNEAGRFVDVTRESGAGLTDQANGCVAADFDGDDRVDLYVTTTESARLLWNLGGGRFVEGARLAGADAFGWYAGAAAGDLNGDGRIDLFVAGYVDLNNRIPDAVSGFPNTYRGTRDLLYINEGRGPGGRAVFREVGGTVGLEVVDFEYGLGAVMVDVDADGDLDLYVANETNPNRLYENVSWPGGRAADPEGIGFRFDEVGGPAGVGTTNGSMGVASADYDGNGFPDLYITNFQRQANNVYANSGALHYVDGSVEFGPPAVGVGLTGWGATWADLDLDTDLDLLIANGLLPVSNLAADRQPLQVFANLTAQGDAGAFEDLVASSGIEALGPRNGRGTAAADYDNDGDVDIAVNVLGGDLMLLENRGADGYWLEVETDGVSPGLGVRATLSDGRVLERTVIAGTSYLSSDDPRVHLGLGTADTVTKLEIRWPDGRTTSLTDTAADQIIQIERPT